MKKAYGAEFLHGLQDLREDRQDALKARLLPLIAKGVALGLTDAELEQSAMKAAQAMVAEDLRLFARIGASGRLP